MALTKVRLLKHLFPVHGFLRMPSWITKAKTIRKLMGFLWVFDRNHGMLLLALGAQAAQHCDYDNEHGRLSSAELITLPALQKTFVDLFFEFAWEFLHWKMAGIFGESFLVSFSHETKHEKSSKKSGKIRSKIRDDNMKNLGNFCSATFLTWGLSAKAKKRCSEFRFDSWIHLESVVFHNYLISGEGTTDSTRFVIHHQHHRMIEKQKQSKQFADLQQDLPHSWEIRSPNLKAEDKIPQQRLHFQWLCGLSWGAKTTSSEK